MIPSNAPEVWLRGPLPDVPPLLQPVAHALLQAREEVNALMVGFADEQLRQRPAGPAGNPVASAGFHLQHLTGVLDRLFTYARGEALTPDQLTALAAETQPTGSFLTTPELVRRFGVQVDKALAQLRTTDPARLTDVCLVGRAQLPATVIGLLVHAAEHTMRHVGGLSVTVRIIAEPAGQ